MNTIAMLIRISCVAGILFLAGCDKPTNNTTQNFDFDWKFYAGEVDNAEDPGFNDADWRTVNLPHDWSIEGDFSKDNPSFSRGGWLPAGKVVYRKTFSIPKNQKGKRFVIYFDGAYRNSEGYINGKLLGKRPLGYIAFHYDMSEYLNYGGENVLTVKLDNSEQPGSRWYTGTGIYRHVKLITSDKLYIPVWGNYIIAKQVENKQATINIETTVNNDYSDNKDFSLDISILDKDGNVVAKTSEEKGMDANTTKVFNTTLTVEDPQLWDIERPYLYTIKTELRKKGRIVYCESAKTGIRTLDFDHINGFKLNGRIVKLNGVCLHHDGGPLGAAIHRRTVERQLDKLREMGCNAVRTAHNPFSEEFMNVCDSMGFLVMNEMFDEWQRPKNPSTSQDGKYIRIPIQYYAHLFDQWADKDLTDFILRDRNHPSVIMWSIGNEIDQMRDEAGIEVGKRLVNIVHELDYRPATNGVHGYGSLKRPNQEAAATSDIYGYNYIEDWRLIQEREMFPKVMAVVTEHSSAQSYYPRATYLYGKEKEEWWNKLGYTHNDAFERVEDRDLRGEKGMHALKLVKERPYLMGMFIWTGWDYLGEVIPYGWPARSSSFGPIDLAGFPKDGFYFYQSQWSDKPMVHIFPHWNLKGMEGKTVQVYGYTNGDELELFQDGVSLGRQKNNTDSIEYQAWDVVYRPGELKAVAYQDGEVISEKVVKTAGAPAEIKVETRLTTMKANGQDLIYAECTIVDKDGYEVPTANNLLSFEVEGEAIIAGVGNGNNMSHEPFQSNMRKAFNGKCLAILQSTRIAGTVKLTVSSEGLQSTEINLHTR